MRWLRERSGNYGPDNKYLTLERISCDVDGCPHALVFGNPTPEERAQDLIEVNATKAALMGWVIIARGIDRVVLCQEHGAVMFDWLLSEARVVIRPDQVEQLVPVVKAQEEEVTVALTVAQLLTPPQECPRCDGYGRLSTHFTGPKRLGGPSCPDCGGSGLLHGESIDP